MMSLGNVTHRQTSRNYFQFSDSAVILGNKKICPVAGFVRVVRHVIQSTNGLFKNSLFRLLLSAVSQLVARCRGLQDIN